MKTISPFSTSRYMRWAPSLTMMLCSFLSYLDRQALAVVAPSLMKETGLNTKSYALIVSAFSIAYMVGNPVWGSLLDRIGLRRGMFYAVSIWTVASVAHNWAAGIVGFGAARAILGFGEGATFPGGLRTVLESLPKEQQSRGIALSYSGGSLGAILTPVIVIPIALHFGWRTAFLITGILGAAWIGLWSLVSKPPYLPADSEKPERFAVPNLREHRFWALVFSYALGGIPLAPVLYLVPIYLTRVFGYSQGELGKVLWIPPLGWELGYFFWGWAADRFAPGKPRPVGFFAILAFLGLPLAFTSLAPSATVALAIFAWATFVAAGFVVLALRSGALTYPREQTALVAGIGAGSWSALVAVVLPIFGGWFDRKSYGLTFTTIAILPIAGSLLWYVFSTLPNTKEPKKSAAAG